MFSGNFLVHTPVWNECAHRPLKIAVVDDSSDHLRVVKEHISQYNSKSEGQIEADYFSDPKDFLYKCNDSYDIALIDRIMPQMSGFDVSMHIRTSYPNMVVIMVSSLLKEHEDADSMIDKDEFKISEIIHRYKVLKKNQTKNDLELRMRAVDYKDVCSK